jgi:phosphate transport system substrate-binding protein
MDGGADIVPMSRSLAPEEISMFAASRGYPPTEIKVAADALAIFVHKSSPLQGLTLEQLHDIFSHAQHPGRNWIETWGQLGLEGEWKDRPIALYGYSADDGAYDTFQRKVLDGGSFRLTVKAERGGSSIVQDIAAEPGGIGYASIFFACNRIRAVPLMGIDGNLHHPTEEGVGEREYPLRRFLYICVDKPPHQALTGPAREFLRFLLSREGQQVVADGGNYSLDAATVEEGRRALGE